MRQRLINIRVEIDQQTDADFAEWSDAEERSKRRHLAILLRKLTHLRKTQPAELERLGLLDRKALAASN